jgi:hypothetical protein
MAGIDNNTVLYLRGDSFNDLSPNPKTVVNNNAVINSDDNGFYIDCSSSKTFKITNHADMNFSKTGFTFEFYINICNTFSNYGKVFDKGSQSNASLTEFKLQYYTSGTYAFHVGDGSTNSLVDGFDIPSSNFPTNTWVHVEFAYNVNTNKLYCFINGVLLSEKTLSFKVQNLKSASDLCIGYQNGESPGASFFIKNFRISNTCRHTTNFTLQSQPFNSINININNQTKEQIDFNITKLGQEIINQVDILVNDEVVQTYNEIGDLTYNVDESIMNYGNNDIKIRVTFDDVYTEEVQTVYFKEVELEDFNPIINLPSNANIQDIVNRISLIGSANKAIKNNLKTLLEAKGFVVGENPRLSNMVKLVNELSNDNSTEITEYINRINELENESEENRQKLIEIIQESNTELSGTESIDTLLKLIDVSKISASQIAQISCGLLHTGILLTDGSVWMCGYGGRIGLDSTTNVNKFTRVTNDVRKLYCLGNNSYIIKNDGTLWACGGNECGQLGLGDTTTRYTFTQVKTNVSDIKEL